MKISAKGRYAIAATIYMAQKYDKDSHITVIAISNKLNISKIYLEQVFSLLKRANIVTSIKGAQGGYRLAQSPEQITAFAVLSAVELSLFEPTEQTVKESAPEIETTMSKMIFTSLEQTIQDSLKKTTLAELQQAADNYVIEQAPMYFI